MARLDEQARPRTDQRLQQATERRADDLRQIMRRRLQRQGAHDSFLRHKTYDKYLLRRSAERADDRHEDHPHDNMPEFKQT